MRSTAILASLLAASALAQTPAPAPTDSAPTAPAAVLPAPTPAPAPAPTQADLSKINLDRVQMRDTGLSCTDIKSEVDLMDKVEKEYGGASRGEISNAATAEAVGQVATGAAIQTGAFGALPLLGPLARLGTQVVMDQKTVEAQDKAKRAAAAKARKEHLTELFIKRDCKL